MGDGARGVLVVNAGSSSIKLAVFAGAQRVLTAAASEIGPRARLSLGEETRAADLPDHPAALAALLDGLAGLGWPLARIGAAGHRVVHGGAHLTAPARVTPDLIAAIEACVPLAPLHNPHNLSAIRALAGAAPGLAQVACFDTAFHATNPPVARLYALPDTAATAGLRRYGFHGLSYAGLVARLPLISGAPLPRRLLALHLGNGASLCAICEGRSVATTMGYSPLDGLTMGTRSGSIDGNAVLELARRIGIDRAARVLNQESGLRGLGGASDMRALRAADTDEARLALAHFAYWAVRHAGSMIAAMGGCDGLAFTGGIGEHDAAMRHEIMTGLAFTGLRADPAAKGPALHLPGSPVTAHVVPADEEAQIAAQTTEVLRLP